MRVIFHPWPVVLVKSLKRDVIVLVCAVMRGQISLFTLVVMLWTWEVTTLSCEVMHRAEMRKFSLISPLVIGGRKTDAWSSVPTSLSGGTWLSCEGYWLSCAPVLPIPSLSLHAAALREFIPITTIKFLGESTKNNTLEARHKSTKRWEFLKHHIISHS